MVGNSRLLKKSYGMQRIGRAIERAVEARTSKEKERAARWAAAWGMLCGIRSNTVRLRRSDFDEAGHSPDSRSFDRIGDPELRTAAATADHGALTLTQGRPQLFSLDTGSAAPGETGSVAPSMASQAFVPGTDTTPSSSPAGGDISRELGEASDGRQSC